MIVWYRIRTRASKKYTSTLRYIFLETILTTFVYRLLQRFCLKMHDKSQNSRIIVCLHKKNLVFFVLSVKRHCDGGYYIFPASFLTIMLYGSESCLICRKIFMIMPIEKFKWFILFLRQLRKKRGIAVWIAVPDAEAAYILQNKYETQTHTSSITCS
jgi:hypothetical protein